MTAPLTLATMAAQLGPDYSETMLYSEYRAGRLHCWKQGRRLFTDRAAIDQWISLCRGNDSRPAFIYEADEPLDGLSRMARENYELASALNTARNLRKCKERSSPTSPSGSADLPARKTRTA